MKKVILFVLMITIILSNVSCVRVANSSKSETTTGTETTDYEQHPSGWDIYDYEEYKAEVLPGAPSYFVAYEQISSLSASGFSAFMGDGFPLQYSYFIIHDDQNDYTLYFYHLKETELEYEEQTLIPDHPDDLRSCSENAETGMVHFLINNEILYEFADGKLREISFCRDNTRVLFWDNSETFAEFPDDGSLVSRLLNKNTALEAKAEFEAMVFGEE